MKLAKLSEYEDLRRAHTKRRTLSTLRKEAAAGKIPGAFQMTEGGGWWIDLDKHDRIIQDRIELNLVSIEAATQQASANDAADDFDPVVAQILQDMRQ
jgi:hypothetical protein